MRRAPARACACTAGRPPTPRCCPAPAQKGAGAPGRACGHRPARAGSAAGRLPGQGRGRGRGREGVSARGGSAGGGGPRGGALARRGAGQGLEGAGAVGRQAQARQAQAGMRTHGAGAARTSEGNAGAHRCRRLCQSATAAGPPCAAAAPPAATPPVPWCPPQPSPASSGLRVRVSALGCVPRLQTGYREAASLQAVRHRKHSRRTGSRRSSGKAPAHGTALHLPTQRKPTAAARRRSPPVHDWKAQDPNPT
jgi:hypothetical protein